VPDGALQPGESVTIKLTVRWLQPPQAITNCALVRRAKFDPNRANNRSCVTVQADGSTSQVIKSAGGQGTAGIVELARAFWDGLTRLFAPETHVALVRESGE
jgi:hypothetical protein